jgi:hypothetical protein
VQFVTEEKDSVHVGGGGGCGTCGRLLCMCVCVREREREKKREGPKSNATLQVGIRGYPV